jgi:serine/threonine protein phosphatase 1
LATDRAARQFARASRFLLYCLIVTAPLLLGSNRPVSWAVNGAFASLILGVFVLGELLRERAADVEWRLPSIAVAALVLWAGWLVIQASSLTPDFLHHPVWTLFGSGIQDVHGAISLNPSATWTVIAQVIPIAFLGVVAFRLAADRSRARFLLRVIWGIAVAVAAYGLIARYLGMRQAFMAGDAVDDTVLTGSFVNRSAVAAYFTLGLCAALSLIAAEAQTGRSEPGWINRAFRILSASRYDLIAAVILTAAIFATGSRGGVIAAAVGAIVIAILTLNTKSGDRMTGAALVVVVFAALVITAAISSDLLMQRLEGGVSSRDRFDLYNDVVTMITARPLLGHGGGAFADAFPLFHDQAASNVVWLEAHDSYLQLAAEVGIPVAAILVFAALWILAGIARRMGYLSQPAPAAMAALAASAAMAVQSLVDFPVQIQAVGLTLAVLVGAGMGDVSARRPRPQGALGQPQPGRPTGFRRVAVSVRAAAAPVSDPTPAPAHPTVGDNKRLYVFGDIHGRMDLLSELKQAILRDLDESPLDDAVIVGLGDYVDRGPSSREVLDALSSGYFGRPTTCLRGNHEQMLLNFLEDPERHAQIWFQNGASETLRSYGVDPVFGVDGRPKAAAIREGLARAMPPAHILFLQRLPFGYEAGDYVFVHGGVKRGVVFSAQTSADLMWTRNEGDVWDEVLGRTVVHGHTQVENPYLGQFRINLDTGAYRTNRLTCLVLEGEARRLLKLGDRLDQANGI